MSDRRAMIRQYKESSRPAGLFGVRNLADDTLLVGVSTDLTAMLNRQRFQLEMGVHPDKDLQADWVRVGPEAFSFEVLDELESKEAPAPDIRADLQTLLGLWIARLRSEGQKLYPSSTRGV